MSTTYTPLADRVANILQRDYCATALRNQWHGWDLHDDDAHLVVRITDEQGRLNLYRFGRHELVDYGASFDYNTPPAVIVAAAVTAYQHGERF